MATTLDWYGCATFRMKTAGLTIFLDAYIDRMEGAEGPKDGEGNSLSAADVDECDWLVVGHSHFDHLWGAESILANTDATLIASYESVRLMEAAGIPLDRMICVGGGETVDLGNGVTVAVYPSQHSCVWSHAKMEEPGEVCIGDLGVLWQGRQERMGALGEHLRSLGDSALGHLAAGDVGHSDRGDGGALIFHFETPDGSVLYQDTSGHWSGVMRDLRPDVALLGAAGRGNIDGEPIQGSLAQFVARQADMLRPAKVILTHHDNWMPGFSVPANVAPIREEMERVVPRTELVEIDYLDGTEILPL